jgi:E3 ubiquitin-protein ligase DOA10
LDTGSDSSQGRGRETESDSDIDVRLHDVARLMRNRLERERVREPVPDPEPEPVRVPVREPIREPVQQRQPVQQPAVEPVQEAVAPEGPPQNARVNINVDIDDDGEIVAQIEVNDFQGFMDLVGLNGPITKLLQNVALVHLLVFVVLGVGVWVPFMLGSVTNYFVLTILMPALEFMFTKSIGTIQKITDPVVEPVVDFLLVALNVSSSSNTTVSASVNNGTAVSYLNTLYKLFGIPTSAKNATSGVPFGPYHPNFFQSFQEDLLSVILGYSTITIFFLVYLNYSTMNNNGYVGNLARVVHAIQTNIGIGIKLFVYLVLEIVLFPFFSACLIDLVTLPLFSTTVASRYQFYEKFPTMFLCLHWVIGTVFMYYFAQ